MSFPFFDAPSDEPSGSVAFAGNRIDRRSEQRSDDSAERALADPTVRILLLAGGRICLRHDGSKFDPYFGVAEARALDAALDHAVLLGDSAHGPVVAAAPGVAREDLPPVVKGIDYRSVYMQGLIAADALGELAQGAALLAWNEGHRYCGRCGAATEMRAGGYRRVCTGCGVSLFPRTDPVVIMLALRGGHCLLGRSPHFDRGRYSALAGFLEPGETIEDAVRRETFEESGIRIGRVAYHASQPWPFPHSLMIGCFGEALNEEIDPDTDELEDCRWFSREEVLKALNRDPDAPFSLPPPGAIASHLIRAWALAGGPPSGPRPSLREPD